MNSVSHTITTASATLSIPALTLTAGNTNTIAVTSSILPISLAITAPAATFYPATSFSLTGEALHTTCPTGFCAPVGAKITDISSTGSASLSITAPTTDTAAETSKLAQIYFCNNDIAFDTSWTTGTNTRNLSVSVNGVITRVEVPLSGRSSELFTATLGWDDTGVFEVLLPGWKTGNNAVVVGNTFGAGGLVDWGADFVGLGVVW